MYVASCHNNDNYASYMHVYMYACSNSIKVYCHLDTYLKLLHRAT